MRMRAGSRRLMRVLMTTDAVGGVWTYAIDLCRELRTLGVETALVAIGPAPTETQTREAERVSSLTTLPHQLDWLCEDATELAATADALKAIADRHEADVVHLNTPAYAALARFDRPVLAVNHSCLATWWGANRGHAPLPADFAWRAALNREGLTASDLSAAPSRTFSMTIALAYGLERPPAVIHNGRAVPVRGAPDGVASAPVVFTAGRLWDEGKNVVTLDRAAARLPVPFHAAGPTRGPHGATVELKNLRPLGALGADEMAAALSHRPVFVSAAIYEPFGLSVLEAAQQGCALVLADTPTFRELWEGAALFAAPFSEAGFAGAIASLLNEPATRAEWGRRAREHAKHYGAARMAGRVRTLYEHLFAGSSALRQPAHVA